MNRDLLELIRTGLGDDSYADLFRRAGWHYKTKISLIQRDTLQFRHYLVFFKDIGAKLYVISREGIYSEVNLDQERRGAVDEVFDRLHISKADVGRMWGVERATAWARLERASFSMEEFVRMLNLVGATMSIRLDNGMVVFPELEGEEVSWNIMHDETEKEAGFIETEFGKVHCPSLLYHGDMSRMSEGERYYTVRSTMISSYKDEEAGIIKDLFRDEYGKYFFAIYDIQTVTPLRIQAATRDDARLFVAGHGTV
jgi:hypothetical protein